MAETNLKPPPGLRTETRKWWTTVVSTWALEEHHLHLLASACYELDRAEEARLEIRRAGGAVFTDRWGQPKEHPARKVEREARVTFTRILRELNLSEDAAPEAARPPALNGRYGRKNA
jgi:phage terminase small subunit